MNFMFVINILFNSIRFQGLQFKCQAVRMWKKRCNSPVILVIKNLKYLQKEKLLSTAEIKSKKNMKKILSKKEDEKKMIKIICRNMLFYHANLSKDSCAD